LRIPKLGTCAGRMLPGSVTASARLRRRLAGCLAIFLAVPFGAATAEPQQTVPAQRSEGTPSASTQPPTGVNPPNAGTTQPAAADSTGAANTGSSAQNAQAGPTGSAPEQQPQSGTQNPVGTAAAPYEKTTGVAASRPAGAVIAPAKQKRKRSFLIRVGLILAGAAAIGTVVALSNGSPSRP
jgi:cobalamin biosynthesis Mg chelatase CobN